MIHTFKKTALSALIMAVLFGAAGLIYVYFSGKDTQIQPKATESKSQQYVPLPAPKAPNPKTPVGVALESLISPVKPGENSSIEVQTTADATCTISVVYNNVPSKDSGLITKKANNYGIASWSWTVPAGTPAGTWPVNVNCKYLTHSGYLRGNLVVSPR